MKFSTTFTRQHQSSSLPQEMRDLAEQLAQIHGNILVAREKNGIHAYMACPTCLMAEGDKELTSRHLAVNLDKYFGRGRHDSGMTAARAPRSTSWFANADKRVASCMKHPREHVFTVQNLMEYAPLEKRNIAVSRRGRVTFSDSSAWLVPYGKAPDGTDIWVPGGPSDGTPGSSLPINSPEGRSSPGGQYLLSRNYDLDELWTMFGTSFIVREFPQSENRKYRVLPGGFLDSHQGRVSFVGYMYGVPRIYQTRILDVDVPRPDGHVEHWVFNGQTMQWVLVAMITPQGVPVYQPGFNLPEFPWKPSKYRSANGSQKAGCLLGLDAAIEWNRIYRPGLPAVGIVFEGPLDAGRIGRPSMATLGKFISTDQAELLARHFAVVIQVPDNDAAGEETFLTNQTTLRQCCRTIACRVPQFLPGPDGTPRKVKDAGNLTPQEAATLKQQWLAQV